MKQLRIAFLLPHYTRNTTSRTAIAMRILADSGVVTEAIHPMDRVMELAHVRVEHDLYVYKKTGGVASSLAGMLHALGAAMVSPYPATAALRDKIVAVRILHAAGLPTPASYIASRTDDLASLLDAGPLVVKPYQGTSGHGVTVVRTPAELTAIEVSAKEPVFAQRYHQPDGRDRKLYVIGDRVFGVKKVFPAKTPEQKAGEPFEPNRELRDLALRCGRAFGIDLFGVDIIQSRGRPYVVDMSI